VPTLTFRLLFVFIGLRHDRRELIYFNVTDHPTARWAARQLIEAFPEETAPKYLLRDRDAIYGEVFTRGVDTMGIRPVITAPRACPSPKPRPIRWASVHALPTGPSRLVGGRASCQRPRTVRRGSQWDGRAVRRKERGGWRGLVAMRAGWGCWTRLPGGYSDGAGHRLRESG
jgi:hypothetical protein